MSQVLYQKLLDALPQQHRDYLVFGIFTLGLLALQWNIETLGYLFAERFLPKKEVKEKKVTNERQVRKVGESLWRFSFYSSVLIYGYSVVSDKDFYRDSTKLWGVINKDSAGRPVEWIMPDITLDLHFYYFIELAFYSAATFLHVTRLSQASENKDYWVMLVHHLSTIALIASSYHFNVYRVGVMVMLLHDWCDPFLEIAKLLKYFKYMDFSLAMFVTFGVVFHVTRLYMYPAFVLRSALVETADLLPLDKTYNLYYYFANALLFVILVLNGVWSAYILKGFGKVLFQGSEVHDARSDDEDDSS